VEFTFKNRVKLNISGIVQGVGFRPFVYQLAHQYSLCGYVYNNGSGVVIEVEGPSFDIDSFVRSVKESAPPLSVIHNIQKETIPCKNEHEFKIITSTHSDISTLLSPDISLCKECFDEMHR